MTRRIYGFGEKVHQKLQDDDTAKKLAYGERSGKISGGKLGKPTLWAVLDMIGVPTETDPYLLGKFLRGNDVEARAIEMLTSISMDIQKRIEGQWANVPEGAILAGQVNLQMPGSYRGGTGYIDIGQRNQGNLIKHEIKSVTKMAYDKVAASGRSRDKQGFKAKGAFELDGATGEPYYHHAIQLAYYCLDEKEPAELAFLHYFNADDYRLTSFEINPPDYKPHIDQLIDSIHLAFESKTLPLFSPFLGWHKAYKRGTYDEFNDLQPDQMIRLLESKYPEAYKKFMETTL